jgi:hypothetical protein
VLSFVFDSWPVRFWPTQFVQLNLRLPGILPIQVPSRSADDAREVTSAPPAGLAGGALGAG